jgi:hypothetical protein
MSPRKLSVLIACFSYGGNGGLSSEHPDVRNWLLQTVPKMQSDPRIGEVQLIDIADTPITMSRNKAVVKAREGKFDLLLMVDSDMRLDVCDGLDHAKPFWDTSFDAIYDHYDEGPLAIGAPYCGPPPYENVYVFRWRCKESNNANPVDAQLDQYTREEAHDQGGIKPVAALPTGLILFDMRIFDVTDPKHQYESFLARGYPEKEAKDLTKPWFYYEWNSLYGDTKASTEDVTATRDMALIGYQELGYNPVMCNWDAWAGHWKPKCVGKPMLLTNDEVSERYAAAAKRMSRNTKSIAWKSPAITRLDFSKAITVYE